MAEIGPSAFLELAGWLENWAAGINFPASEETVGDLDGDYGLSSLEPRINDLVLWLKCRNREGPANELERQHHDFRARLRAQYPRPVDSEKALNCAMLLIKLLRGIEEGLSQTRVRRPKRKRRKATSRQSREVWERFDVKSDPPTFDGKVLEVSAGYCREILRKLVQAKGKTVKFGELYDMSNSNKIASDALRGFISRLREPLASLPVVIEGDKAIGYRLVQKP